MKIRKILLFIMSLFLLMTAITLPGCGGKSRSKQARIRVFQTSGNGGIARIMPKLIINSNIAYADNMELGVNESYILYTSSTTNVIRAYVEDDNGIRKTDAVTVTPDYSSEGMAKCIDITHQLDIPNGGVDFGIRWASSGKCKIVLTGGGLTREINILAWNLKQNLSQGIIVDGSGYTPVNKEDGDIYEEIGDYCLNGDWYLADTCNSVDWMQKFKEVTEVKTGSFKDGPHVMKMGDIDAIGDIYVSRAKNGGFIKSVRLKWTDLVFDYCGPDGQFRDF